MQAVHAQKIKDVFELVSSSKSGLTRDEASRRLHEFGANKLPEREKVSQLALIVQQFHSWFIYILVAAAVISFVFDKTLDGIVIIAIVMLNAVIGYVQESRAEHAIEALRSLIVPKAKALRDGSADLLSAEELVPGDVIMLQAGDRIPADARIIHSRDAATQESSLTGESFPVMKDMQTLAVKIPLAERSNMLWMGTMVTSGTATAVVVSTGISTMLGSIATSIKSTERDQTHFRKKTNHLALILGSVAIVAAGVTFSVGFWVRDLPVVEVFIFSVATLVSSIPEGLPAVLAVVLAIGAYRMARKKAIVRHLPVIEDLSVASVILTDKTGTLTQNTMTVQTIATADRSFSVSGEGWDSTGSFYHNRNVLDPVRDPVLHKAVSIATLCNSAEVHKEEGRYEIIGDPTEAAFWVLGSKAGLSKEVLTDELNVLDQAPFSQKTRMQAVLVGKPKKEIFIIGGDEAVLQASSHYLSETGVRKITIARRRDMKSALAELTGRAMRVVACAYKPAAPTASRLPKDFKSGYIFVAYLGIVDPIRPEAARAVADARRAGIRVIMATGDHADTARAIAKEIGLITLDSDEKVLTGDELESLSRADFKKALGVSTVYARMTPEMKMRIISELQNEGKVVAMIGDGVNDAPGLKKANVGIAMGTIGTDVAREASDIILSDDNFATLIRAIEQGRLIFNNIRQTSFFMITTNMAEIATIVVSLFVGNVLPLTALQILWINLITDGIPNVALAAERKHEDLLERPPRSIKETIISKEVAPFLIIVVVLMAGTTLLMFQAYLPYGVERARTVAFALMTFFQLFNAMNMRSLRRSIFSIGIFSNPFMTGALLVSFVVQLLVMIVPFTREAFGLELLSILEFVWIILISGSIIVVVELFKILYKITSGRKDRPSRITAHNA